MSKDPNYSAVVEWILSHHAHHIMVEAIVLCGSRARGTADPVSDLDLLVVIQGTTQYLQWGTFKGMATEVLYVPETLLNEARPGLFVGREIFWCRDGFDVSRVPDPQEAVTSIKEPVGYAAWDLRHALQILGYQLQQHDFASFWYGVGLWIPEAVRYVLAKHKVAIPTQRRQWSLLESIVPDTATRLSRLYGITDPERVYEELLEIIDCHLVLALPAPIEEAFLVPLNSERGTSTAFTVRRLNGQEASLIAEYWQQHWGSSEVVSQEVRHLPQAVTGWVAEDTGGSVLGMVTVQEGTEWEVVSLDSDRPGQGIGSALLHQVEADAREARVPRLWLITSNDNLAALGFYQRRGGIWWQFIAVPLTGRVSLKPQYQLGGSSGSLCTTKSN